MVAGIDQVLVIFQGRGEERELVDPLLPFPRKGEFKRLMKGPVTHSR